MQQINLYLPEFQPNREPLRSIHMLWGVATFIILLIAVSVMSAQRNQQRTDVLEHNRLRLEQLKIQVVQLEQQRPKNNLADLDAQAVALGEELNRREQIFHVIANKDLGNNHGFSAHLEALGRQSLETISVEVFSILAGGNYLELAGKATAVDQIPLYIQRLRSESAFTQSAVGILNAVPLDAEKGVYSFSLAKKVKGVFAEEPKSAVQMLLEKHSEAKIPGKDLRGAN